MRNTIEKSKKSSGRAFWHFSVLAALSGCNRFYDKLADVIIGDQLKDGHGDPTCTECDDRADVYYTLTYDATIGSSATIDLEEFLPTAFAKQGETIDIDFDQLSVGGSPDWLNALLLDNNTRLQLGTSPAYDNPDFDGAEGFYVILTADDYGLDTYNRHIYRIQFAIDVAPAWGADVQTHWAIPTSDSSYSLELPTPMDDGRSDVTYSLLNAPAGVSLTDTTLTGSATGVAITYVATDAFNTATLTLTIEDNVAPDWATAEGNGSLTTTIEFGTGLFTTTLVAAEDANIGQALTYSVDGLPEEWLFHATTRELIGTFDATQPLRTFDYTVSDGEFEDITTITLDFD